MVEKNAEGENSRSSLPLDTPLVFWLVLASLLLFLFFVFSSFSQSDSLASEDCTFSNPKPKIDEFIEEQRVRIADQGSDVLACNDYADLLSGSNEDADMLLTMLPNDRSCAADNSGGAEDYLQSRAMTLKPQADHVCGVGLERRVEAGKQRAEFTDLLSNEDAGTAARQIGARMVLFAPDIELRNCLEASGIHSEPAVMAQPFSQIVASCEVLLHLPAQSPEQRWQLPSIDVAPEEPVLSTSTRI